MVVLRSVALLLLIRTAVTTTTANNNNTQPNQANAPAVGAIRWDAWYGGDIDAVGTYVQQALTPEKWRYRLPFFAAEDTGTVVIHGNTSAVMEQELASIQLRATWTCFPCRRCSRDRTRTQQQGTLRPAMDLSRPSAAHASAFLQQHTGAAPHARSAEKAYIRRNNG